MNDGKPVWQPIETAPRDRTRFWGNDGKDAICMFWHEGFQEFVSGYRRMEFAPGYSFEYHDGPSGKYDDGRHWYDHSPEVRYPTHWMPLPEPPEEA